MSTIEIILRAVFALFLLVAGIATGKLTVDLFKEREIFQGIMWAFIPLIALAGEVLWIADSIGAPLI